MFAGANNQNNNPNELLAFQAALKNSCRLVIPHRTYSAPKLLRQRRQQFEKQQGTAPYKAALTRQLHTQIQQI